jgi:type IV conjugative transfer system protein TraL
MEKKVPQFLSKPIQLVWFEIDEVCMGMLFFLVFLLFTNWFTTIALFVCPFLFSKYKKNFPQGFLGHIFYFIGFKELTNYPDSYVKKFLG